MIQWIFSETFMLYENEEFTFYGEITYIAESRTFSSSNNWNFFLSK